MVANLFALALLLLIGAPIWFVLWAIAEYLYRRGRARERSLPRLAARERVRVARESAEREAAFKAHMERIERRSLERDRAYLWRGVL